MSPALAGGFITTEPAGKPPKIFFKVIFRLLLIRKIILFLTYLWIFFLAWLHQGVSFAPAFNGKGSCISVGGRGHKCWQCISFLQREQLCFSG